MRTILYTGKGGVGKTSVAAATALKASSSGKRVLVMSTDPAHSLSDAFDAEVGSDPKEMAPGLWAQEMDYTAMLEESWAEIRDYMTTLFEWQGSDALAAEELALLPGMDELFGLLAVRRHHKEGAYDALIVDAAPTGETLKLLSLPDQVSWYVEKIFPIQRRAAKIVRPFARRAHSLPPFPEDSVFAAGQRFYEAIVGGGPYRQGERLRPAGGERGKDGYRGGATRLHLPEPIRLRGGCGGCQSAFAGRSLRPLLRPVARGAEEAHADHRELVLPDPDPHGPPLRPRDVRPRSPQ